MTLVTSHCPEAMFVKYVESLATISAIVPTKRQGETVQQMVFIGFPAARRLE